MRRALIGRSGTSIEYLYEVMVYRKILCDTKHNYSWIIAYA